MEVHIAASKIDKKRVVELVPDICNNVRILKCNRKPAESPSNLFPYARFQYYLDCLNEIERCQRLDAVSRGQQVPPLDFFNDDFLKKEFSTIYGGLDEDSEHFLKLFDNYREERLQEIQQWIQDENEILLLKEKEEESRKAGIVVNNNNDSGSSSRNVPDLCKIFSSEEITLFESVRSGPSSGHEWFILPRKALTTSEIASLKAKKQLNLALFDPELSEYAGTVIPPQSISRSDRGISEKLALNIYEIMCRHPAGISADEFSIEYRNKFKYSPNFKGLGYKNFLEFLIDLNHVVFTQSSGPNNHLMMYPTYLENLIATPMDTCWKIYHKLVIILQLFDGACKTEVLVQFFQDLYHIKLPLTSWGFFNVDEFVVYLINHVKWNNDFYKVEKASLVEGKGDVAGHYVFHMTPARERAIQEKRNSSSTIASNKSISSSSSSPSSDFRSSSLSSHPPQVPSIPKQYVQLDEQILSESDYVAVNTEDIYVVVYYVSPQDFEIVRKQTWDSLKCDNSLSEFYIKLTKTSGGLQPANPKTLKPGLLVVVFDSEHEDYVRARYVRVASKFRCHQVELLDVGGCIDVHQDSIYYMHRKVMKDMKAQVIHAGLFNVKCPFRNSGEEEWNREILDYAYQLMVPKDKSPRLRVQFLMRNNGGKWLVSMKFGPQKKLQDVGQTIMNFCNRFETPTHHKVLKAPTTMDPSASVAISSNPTAIDIEPTEFLPLSPVIEGTHDLSAGDTPCLTEVEGQMTTANGNPKINSSSSSGLEWRSSPATTNPDVSTQQQQKKPGYQPRSYADTAASSAWRSQPNQPNRNFGAESNAFPTLAESNAFPTLESVSNTKTSVQSKRTTGAQSSSFSYANIASSKNTKQ